MLFRTCRESLDAMTDLEFGFEQKVEDGMTGREVLEILRESWYMEWRYLYCRS